MVAWAWNGLPRDGNYGTVALQGAFPGRTVLTFAL